MTDTKYNGWANRETWLVNLWFGDDLTMYEDNTEITPEFIEEMVADHIDFILPRDGDRLNISGFLRDLMADHLIDYRELASHYQD
jgi:hypothetical protein